MNEKGISKQEVYHLLDNAKKKDVDYSRVLSAMCTPPHEIAIDAHIKFIESNMGDYGLFLGTRELEMEVISMMGHLFHATKTFGYISTGGTESNIQAIRSMRNLHGSKNPNIIVSDSAHFSFDKIEDMLKIEIRKAELNSDFKVDINSMENLIDDDTVAIVGIAGSTEFGQIDPIEEISKLALKNNIPLHVDAAFGGFVIPFLDGEYKFDFSLNGVSSISIDPHKMGLSTIPSGILLFKDLKYIKTLQIDTPYLTIDTQYSLTGTRSGAAVAATYATMKLLGKNGYKEIVDYCMDITQRLVIGAKEIGIEPLIDPIMNVVVLDVDNADFVQKKLDLDFGWKVSITRNPKALRLVLMPHTTIECIDAFLLDLKKIVDDIRKN
ncbi:MAG: tyrosine decarboxylase MfnA [Methanosarcinaceae archaeon]|nr:tyrosine decarboxylase MfnA [Methanosarcinaceae archaeon]